MQELSARLGELTGVAFDVRGWERAASGYANVTWIVDADPTDVVIKVQVSPSIVYDRDPGLEPSVLRALASTPVPVPAVVAQDSDGAVFGEAWFAMERLDGISLPDEKLTSYASSGWFAEADPQSRATIWNGFVDALADLHRLPADTFGPSPRAGSHSAVLDYFEAALRDVSVGGDVPVQVRAIEWLRTHAPNDADDVIRPCMADARMANLLARDGAVIALLDWELAYVANPCSDIAYHLYLDARYAAITGSRLSGLPSADETWQRWQERSGLTVTNRHYWEVFAAMSMAVSATRAILTRLAPGHPNVEGLNPFVPDIQRLMSEAGG